jgi:hypothetical protein
LFICSIIYIRRARDKEAEHERILMYGFASFWFSIALARTFFYFTNFLLGETYTGDYYIIFQSLDVVNYIFLYFYLYISIYILINVISLSLIFIWFAIKAKQEFQALSSVMTIGATIFLIGWVFEINAIKILNIVPSAISPILVIIGVIIALSPMIVNFEFFSRALANWIVLISIICIFVFLGLTSFPNLPLSMVSLIIILISSFILIMVIIYIIYYLVKNIRVQEAPSGEDSVDLKNILKIFAKPNMITEEEINYSIEKKRCLVCKGKVSRLNYICPRCNVLYCLRCSNALSNLENACWVCEIPFDEEKSKGKGGDKDILFID